ncbi:MAG TPA: glycerol-3-phosphate dehydrogenase/oxidase [Pirellulales bacterium]|jgi:glycerol-3-phosphate dehydrogenase|nr:glycerol-3-phosphate dehydrogenase/oxidase [Pirellulales bacterium]
MPPTVLILGAGINGAALARELALQGVGVCIVDQADLSTGATAYSSRLIHGGLRYLEYGEFDLVRESLAERERLLKLAPQFVRPLRLFIPVEHRRGGLLRSAARFVKLDRWFTSPAERGLWTVRLGLAMYDRLAGESHLPRHTVAPVGAIDTPNVDQGRYRWLCSYYDAQIQWPERFVVALLHDARRAAAERGAAFDCRTYSAAAWDGKRVTLRTAGREEASSFAPDVIVNATGAWVDRTLEQLHVHAPRQMGPTKGSHLVLHSAALREALEFGGLYAEAADGRPVFVLPFGELSLVGTTDLPYDGDPARVVASEDEIAYLLVTVNHLLPDVRATYRDVLLHYSGVRPLPAADPSNPAAITRRHWMQEHADAPLPMYSIIGGKLTTCRSLAEGAADTILARLGMPRLASTRDRPIREEATMLPGEMPASDDALRQVIRDEWVTTLDDLVERRLMLLYDPSFSRGMLEHLAGLLVVEHRLDAAARPAAVEAVIDRLRTHFGRMVAG